MLKLKRSLGQNFLKDINVIKKISSLGKIENQTIIEVGSGSGNLTKEIIKKRPKKIILIEKDKRLCQMLSKEFNGNQRCEVINKDILEYDLERKFYGGVTIFGNLPYNISTQILAKFISLNSWPPFYNKIIFMFQKEVADRILARKNTKQYGRLSILTNLRLDVEDHFNVSKKCFFPIPKVDSKVVVFKPKTLVNYNILNIKNLEKITNIFFSSRRKMINKPFSKLFNNYEEVAKKLGIKLNLRPSELSYSDYYKITEIYEKNFYKLTT